jgi:Tfp pilus assembly protein PilN
MLPEDYVERRLRQRANVLCLALFGVVMVGVVCAAVVWQQSIHRTEEVERQVEREYEAANKDIRDMERLDRDRQRLHQKALATAPLIERVPRSSLLAVVTNSLPEYASLVRFELLTKVEEIQTPADNRAAGNVKKTSKFDKVSSQRKTKLTRQVVQLKIIGLANTNVEVGRFISNMASNPLIASVKFIYSKEKILDKDQPPVREFQVNAELNQNADAIDVAGEKDMAGQDGQQPLAKTSLGEEL